MTGTAFQSSLFSIDFLQETIAKLPDWSAAADGALDSVASGAPDAEIDL
jgi:hypothetical protein